MSLNVSTFAVLWVLFLRHPLVPLLSPHHSEPAKRWQTNKAQILCSHFLPLPMPFNLIYHIHTPTHTHTRTHVHTCPVGSAQLSLLPPLSLSLLLSTWRHFLLGLFATLTNVACTRRWTENAQLKRTLGPALGQITWNKLNMLYI